MKSRFAGKTLIKIILVLLLPLLYFAVFSGFKSSGNETANKTVLSQIPPTPAPKSFVNCIFNLDPSIHPDAWILNQLGNYSTGLHFNTVHTYDKIDRDSLGFYKYGKFEQDLTDEQKTNIDNLTNAVTNSELDFWYERVKISKLCYAQRLIYEIKDPDEVNLVNNGFCYQNTSGCYETDNGRTVLHLSPDPITNCNEWDAAPRYIASGIYENLQHGDLYVFNLQYADEGVWNVKPMLKIPQDTPDDAEVVKIEIFNYDGNNTNPPTPIKTITLRGMNFKKGGSYNGQYIDEFLFGQNIDSLSIDGGNGTVHNPPQLNDGQLQDNWRQWKDYCHTDFKVKWMGEVEVWFDKMTVDDEFANRLFNSEYEDRITQELDYYFRGTDRTYTFFADEVTYSQFEAIKYVKNKINDYCTNTLHVTPPNLNIASSNYHNIRGYKTNAIEHSIMYQELQPYSVNIDAHEIGGVKIPNTIPAQGFPGDWIAQNYNDYTQSLQLKGFGDRNSITPETSGIGDYDPSWQGSLVYQIVKAREQRNTYSPNTKFIMQPQIHAVLGTTNNGTNWNYGLREPTNEELLAEAMLSIAHGAEGICWYIYHSFNYDVTSSAYCMRPPYLADNPPAGTEEYTFGLLNMDLSYRNSNLYGQTKWNDVRDMNIKIESWKPTLDAVTWQAGYSVHYDGASYYYIDDIISIFRNPSSPYDFNPANEDPIKYWEMGFFEDRTNTKYFIMVNRRCVPVSEPGVGDIRELKIKFNAGGLPIYNVWDVKDVNNGQTVVRINKASGLYYSLGSYQPGEGKLYKIVPVIKSGGTLIADEYIPSGESFTCEDTVWTNGYDLTIEDGVTINFSDSAKFIVHGGTFQLGNAQHSGPNTINIVGESGSWKGFEFDTCNVKIYGVNFSGLANDSISMLTMIDCPLIDLRSNSFSLGTGNNKGAIDIVYSGSYQSGVMDNVYIANNSFPSSSTELPYIKVMAYSGFTTPVIIENNNFTGSSTALFLNNIQGGAIKSNSFTGFSRSLTALTSSLDVYDNTISSSSTGTYGLEALEGTELKMSYAGGLLVGGRNDITNSGTSVYNIYLENSYFLMDEGENIFDIGDDSYHLCGWFPSSYGGEYFETENCFKVEGVSVDPPLHYVTLGDQGAQITDFEFTPYLTGCIQGGEGDMMVINLGNGIYDTIGIMGEGGSYSSNYIVTPKSIYDSISISMRYRNYANVKTLCLYLLNTYPDSAQSLGAVSKLYLAVSKTDTTTQGLTDLKTLYESLILNHSENVSLVKRCNYYVQKCKVLLHQYSLALSGFQQIINNNPASYEGLIARWDYMATSLLMQGQGGGEEGKSKKAKVKNLLFESDKSDEFDKSDKFDDDKFTREERKQIKQAVTTALEVSKYTEKKREEVLTELSTRGDVNATKQLKVLNSLKQTVKTEKPKNISEHMKIVAGDIQKVFVNPDAGRNENTVFIPQEFSLSQNYPNPFNPVTRISYDIPFVGERHAFHVQLIVYDILGREVMKLVNNEFKQPGRYVVEFNGTNLASGVYFYRIEVLQAGSSTGDFIASKKMVLVK